MPNKPLLKIMKAQSEGILVLKVFDFDLPVYFLVPALFLPLPSPNKMN